MYFESTKGIASILTKGERENRILPMKIIGQSLQTLEMIRFIDKAATNDISVLLEGESGTGKELVAQAIHDASSRAAGPFVAVNCGALNANLIESELFGHERGAFTGAIARRLGRFERAQGGTLLLDEVGELPLPAQVKLLRALQERRIERVGGVKEIKIDIRVMAATNRNLWAEVEAGNFRQDLYFRLAVINLKLTPLRDRREDIIPLAQHFLQLHNLRKSRPPRVLTPEAEAILLLYEWPGNVRELENVIECALALTDGERIHSDALIPQIKSRPPLASAFRDAGHPAIETQLPSIPPSLNDLALRDRRELVKKALSQCRGNRTHAARLLGLPSRYVLYRLMKKLHIDDSFG